jgi:hypothetical protein
MMNAILIINTVNRSRIFEKRIIECHRAKGSVDAVHRHFQDMRVRLCRRRLRRGMLVRSDMVFVFGTSVAKSQLDIFHYKKRR